MNIWDHFSKKTFALIILLTVITAGLLYFAIREEQPVTTPTPTPTPKISHAFSTLSLVPQTASAGAFQTVAIHVESNQNKLSGAQLNISYDPTILGNVSVRLGNYFTNPSVLLNTVDTKNGQITLVLAIQPTGQQASGSGTVATISYSILPTANHEATLSFLPKTSLTQEGELESVLKTATSLTIQVPNATPKLPAASTSAQ